jgi:hypothetical protein
MKSPKSWILISALSFCLISLSVQSVGQGQTNRQRTRSRTTIPNHNYGHDSVRFSVRQFAVADQFGDRAVVPNALNNLKPFHFRSTAVALHHLRLDEVGLAIDRLDGRMIATGRITHDGGDGGMIGSNVTVRVRALMARTADVAQIPPDSVVVWESECKLWVPRGQQTFSLVPRIQTQAETLRRYFDAITHIDVEMEYSHDR